MSRPVLYVFAISHYCEKARWALDFLGVDYELRHLAPGLHFEVARKLGAPGSSVPWLTWRDGVVQGSGEIIDWAESQAADPAKTLRPDPAHDAECRALEKRLDETVGVHVRRYYYSEALVEHPDTVRPVLTRGLSEPDRETIEQRWDGVRQLMMGAMDLGAEQGQQSRDIVAGELDWLDGLLADGRRHLVGDRFSRADITAASLLAPLVRPPEHPTYDTLQIPPRARTELAAWAERPILSWVRQTYRDDR